MGVKDRPQCYFDVELNREPVGRIVFQLFSDVCPKTSKNFLCLCTGERGTGKITGKKLCYKGSTFHRVVKNFMVQGGDFTEGNGRGGESIYGGYFEDENFILKHDRAFLLSMANRGKDTNGSQFFITTKTAPHLDGVHVVFGLIISGFEVIKKVEGLKTDSASRPYADVRVMDCGQLFTKSANDVLEGKRKRTSRSADSSLHTQDSSSPLSSSVGSESEFDERCKHRKHKRHGKSKRSKRKRRESKKDIDVWPANQSSPSPVERETLEEDGEVEAEQEPSGRREKPVVRPEEIPPVPENRFLLRRDMPSQEAKTEIVEKEEQSVSTDPKPAVSKSGRKIKGRGTMRYHTPTRSKSRSASVEERRSSETPPHWKEEMKRTKVYQPPSIERWSKGDKLNDLSSSRWEDRSDSAWSRSAERSSDRSSEGSSLRRQQITEKKKAKRKKKAKKRKHDKKNSSESKPQEPVLSVGRRSVSSEMKSRRSRSSSNLNNSSTWRQQSPLSLRDSRSYSRSYTPSQSRSKGRSRSYSRSSSLSRSRGRSLSRSYSRSQSRSRSRSQYRSRSLSPPRKKSLSRSPRKRNASKHKADSVMSRKLPESKVPPAPRPPSAPAPESAPVIPMSDSPPPSRWKPDQKPWRPSYIHTQEIKAKVAPSSSTGQTVAGITEGAQTPKGLPADSESHKSAGRSLSRSSRSRSYSRSYSRSRSRSYSRSRSPHKHKSRSSSYSRSNSENSQNTPSNKKSTLGKEWKEYYGSLSRIKNVDKYISTHSIQDALPGSEKTASCEPGPDASDPRRNGSSEKIKESASSQDEDAKHCSAVLVERFNSKSEWDSDSDKVSQSNRATKQKQAGQSNKTVDKKLSALTGWNSESDCENITAKTLAISEKEEGEASSESECETRMPSEALVALAPVAASSWPEASTEKALQPEKHKSKKKSKRKCRHKRRSANKSGSHHRKDKGKRSKRKHQRLKETFHWQPPLEFGEEEEEDESKREKPSPGGALKERPGVGSMKERCSSLNKIRNAEKEGAQQKTDECIKKRPKRPELHLQSCNRNGANLPSVKEPESLDEMDLCTPEHDAETVEHPAAQVLFNSALILTATSRSSAGPSRGGALHEEPPPVPLTTSAGRLQDEAPACRPAAAAVSFKWRPLKGMSALRDADAPPVAAQRLQRQEAPDAQSVRMEIKSTSRVRPGSLFDEVRKTARLNQRPRNQESSSEESSASGGSTRSPKKSRSASSRRSRSRGWSRSYSRSRSRSRSSSYSSRSRSRSRRRRRGRGQSRSRSRTYRSYGSHSRASSRSHSRSRSYNRRRRSRSDSYDSYSSRSASRRRGRRRSDSYRSSDRRSRSYRSSSGSSSGRSRSSRYS
ncbi:NK-tumor recognition protein isoform X1 [Pungitius pungitius]|uniref:NK-tumor recognition protein isoform X1 n=3 Tax=Pungitius pungitius TaxID=134920 RepID=UPI002E0DEE30